MTTWSGLCGSGDGEVSFRSGGGCFADLMLEAIPAGLIILALLQYVVVLASSAEAAAFRHFGGNDPEGDALLPSAQGERRWEWTGYGRLVLLVEGLLQLALGAFALVVLGLQKHGTLPYPLVGQTDGASHDGAQPAAYIVALVGSVAWIAGALCTAVGTALRRPRPWGVSAAWLVAALCSGLHTLIACESWGQCGSGSTDKARRVLWEQAGVLWALGFMALRDLASRAGARPGTQGELLVDAEGSERWWGDTNPLDSAGLLDRVWFFYVSPLLTLGRAKARKRTMDIPRTALPDAGTAEVRVGSVTLTPYASVQGKPGDDVRIIAPGDVLHFEPDGLQLTLAQKGGEPQELSLPEDLRLKAEALGNARLVAELAGATHDIPDTITAPAGGLAHSDLYPLQDCDKADSLLDVFRPHWEKELRKPNPRLWLAMVHAFGAPFFVAAMYKFFYDALQFVGPNILQAMIQYVKSQGDDSPSDGSQSGSEPAWSGAWDWVDNRWRGYWLTAIITVCSVVQTAVLHQYFFLVFRVGQRLRSVVITAVYTKAMRLSAKARQGQPVGRIVNLMSADATRMQDLTTYLAVLWSGPFQVILALFFLGELMGVWPTLTGLGVAVVMIPLNTVISKRMKSLTQKVMTAKDARVNVTNEALLSIKLVKCNAWEPAFAERITEKRNKEVNSLRKYMYTMGCLMVFWGASPLLVSLSAFGVWVAQGNELDAAKAFTALALFNILRFPLNMLPSTINNIVEASVSFRRIQDFLMLPEIDAKAVTRLPPEPGGAAIEVHGGAFSWGFQPEAEAEGGSDKKDKKDGAKSPVPQNGGSASDDDEKGAPVLEDVNFTVPAGRLTAVVGEVGCGKTSLLHAVLGELEKLSGSVTVRGRVAFVPQTAFIANMTLRDNILWGRPYDPQRYARVLRDCSLDDDLKILPDGDSTEIGEAGINLSGGQRQRVSLARAVYSDADIYLLDDVLSAVDAHVGRAIFSKCLCGALKGRTRVLVTHGMQYLPSCDSIAVLEKGRVAEQGSYSELAAKKDGESVFGRLVAAHEHLSVQATSGYEQEESDIGHRLLSERRGSSKLLLAPAAKASTRKATSVETSSVGDLRAGTYQAYMRAYPGGAAMAWFIVFVYAVSTGLNVLQNWYLSYWTSHTGDHKESTFLGYYALVGFGYLIGLVVRQVLLAYGSTGAALTLHEHLLQGVLRAPMSFFYVTPTGRLLNRFSQDTYTLDEKLGTTLAMAMSQGMTVVATIFVIALSTPLFLIVVPVILGVYWQVQEYYIPLSRDFKRIDAVSRSPIYSHFQESLVGVTTIRAYGDADRFRMESVRRLDSQQTAYFLTTTGNRWLAVRLETIGTSMVFFASFFVVLARDSVPAGMAGLSISYALSVTQSLNWMVRMRSDLESQIVSAERVLEYAELESEPQGGDPAPAGWPSGGRITGEAVTLRYRPELPPVLHSVDFEIRAGEKIGICGRTGAGKSSLFIALLRLAHPESVLGTIKIDDVPIGTMKLRDLRRSVAVIPQESQLFLGTVRSNLDPFGEHSDDRVWESLAHVRLADAVRTGGGLDASVAQDGENWSHGQRQLLCTARALLRGCKVVLLDEATAACDAATDRLLQTTFAQVFKNCTVITVAHRLHAISDSDRIMVLSNGRIEEFDPPQKLLQRPDSLYRKLVAEAARQDGAAQS
eukprot:TRINITY_DN59931_c0_g1_i1.p1 TRINITY_DN59931_c0_g1~~TRINITY_DN59931_c0_g1_i1.p1  ORF type:complete len:1671 (+),score=589.83 TRINITY_DN59931_c0_g1_i1:104-5116(+)